MRVITGTARRTPLVAPKGEDTRPTGDMVKEALFSIIQFEVEGSDFLDLFAGSGQLGIEALSRGARSAVFVDTSAEAVSAIEQNLKQTRLFDRAKVLRTDAEAFLSGRAGQFDFVLLDPPYRSPLLMKVLPMALGVTRPGGAVICETDTPIPQTDEIPVGRAYRYGRVTLTVFRKEEAAL